MTFRKMLVLPVALLIAASTLSAFQAKPVDVTGVWAGTFTPSTGDQSEAHRQVEISNGKVTTVKGVTSVTFDATQPNGLVLKFDLEVVEGRLKGKATAEAKGEKREAVVDVGRAK